MIKKFLKYIELERRYSRHTVVAYENDLKQFDVFLKTIDVNLNLELASYTHIRSWIISLVEDKIIPNSINRKMVSLRSYYKFLLQSNLLKDDPSVQLKSFRTPKKLVRFAQANEMKHLFEKVNFGNDFTGLRDQLLMELFYATGMRRIELINLKVSTINIEKKQIKVLGKGNKERLLPLHTEAINLIQRYLIERDSKFKMNTSTFLLLSDKGRIMSETFVYRKVKKYLGFITSLEKKSPHILRHSFATHLLNNGADINAIKELLGHRSLAATQVYTHNSLGELKKVFKKAHPKS